jgi:hypothetical protein
MAAAALILGLAEASHPILAYVEATLGEDYWQRMRTYHQQAIRYGLRAPQPGPDFLARIVQHAATGLRERGFGEERLLAPIERRLHRHLNPAQSARAVFHADGLAAMVEATAIRL